ncbi:MAG: hypothetical protein ABGX16_19500 [Pirellulales bacterium]
MTTKFGDCELAASSLASASVPMVSQIRIAQVVWSEIDFIGLHLWFFSFFRFLAVWPGDDIGPLSGSLPHRLKFFTR